MTSLPRFDYPPLPVEITNHADWWQPWLPLGGSLVVAFATFIGVLLNNRRGDRREMLKWRRDTILKLSSDALSMVLSIENMIQAAMARDADATVKNIRNLRIERRKLKPIADSLRMVGAPELAEACMELSTKAGELDGPADKLREALDAFLEEAKEVPKYGARRDDALGEVWVRRTGYPLAKFQAEYGELLLSADRFTKLATAEITEIERRRWYFLWLR